MSSLIVSTQDNDDSPALQGTQSTLNMRLFGPIEVRIRANPLPRLRSRKGLWLLALLALRAGRSVERIWLAGNLWPDSDEVHALRSLRQSLHDLRHALASESCRLGRETTRTLCLDLSGLPVDVLLFDDAIARGDPGSLKAAIGLYRGPLLEDCTEELVVEERHLRERNYLAALEALASEAAKLGEYAAVPNYLRQAISIEPYREDLHRALMQSQVKTGNPSEALHIYRQLRESLRREMGAPADETTALFRQIRDETRERAHIQTHKASVDS